MLYKYPNIMKRNARYRGHRESEKVLHDHQEQIYEIRQLYKELERIEDLKGITISSWFQAQPNLRISMEAAVSERKSNESHEIPATSGVDSARGFTSDMVQWNGNSTREHMVGIYELKRRMQELDERIAEAERKYRGYENTYK